MALHDWKFQAAFFSKGRFCFHTSYWFAEDIFQMIFLELSWAGVKALTIWSCRSDYKISHLGCSQLFWWFSFCFPLMFGLSTGLNEDFLKMLFLFGFELNQTDLFFHFNALISCILCSHCLRNCLSLNIFYGYALLTHSGYIILISFSLYLLCLNFTPTEHKSS